VDSLLQDIDATGKFVALAISILTFLGAKKFFEERADALLARLFASILVGLAFGFFLTSFSDSDNFWTENVIIGVAFALPVGGTAWLIEQLLKIESKAGVGALAGLLVWVIMQFTQQNEISLFDAVVIAGVGSIIGFVITALEKK
jgi:hypothetical protein